MGITDTARITFTVNGVKCSVGCEVTSQTTLLEYLRNTLGLKGTKYMCLEGGCGACIVSVVKSPGQTPQSVNSCLASITSCMNWEITTIEGIGNRSKGYHQLQKQLAENNGSQCGYCSPGMVMNMYNVLQTPHTMKEIERAMGSNICRCTGYRPIIGAMTPFASDAPNPMALEMEDMSISEDSGCCSKNGCCSSKKSESAKEKSDCSSKKSVSDWCMVSKNEAQDQMLHLKLKDGIDWYRPSTFAEVFDRLEAHGMEDYMLVCGNTEKGVTPLLQYPKLLIDITGIPELFTWYLDQNLVIGAGCSLAEMIARWQEVVGNDGFSYLQELILHMDEVAHVSVRNCGSIGGNLMIKKRKPGFQSDVYLILETCGGQVTILQSDGVTRILSMQNFLKEDMKGKIIVNVIFPPLGAEYKMRTYKVMPRSQSVHALVNAGFCFKLDENNVVQEARMTFGALSTNFTRCYKSEKYLVGKNLFENSTLQGCIESLDEELVIVEDLNEPPVEYRRIMSFGLFYKCILSLCPEDKVSAYYKSGGIKLRGTRQVSEAHQIYETNPTLWPITKPLPKTDGLVQVAGEAQYTDDIPLMPNEVFGAFILAKVPLGTIEKIDTTEAMGLDGVIACYFAEHITGNNSFIPAPNSYNLADEELFCNGEVKYFDQPIGVIVCESQAIANYAATLVKVTYTNVKKPVIDINEAKKDSKRTSVFQSIKATSKGTDDVYKVIKGNNTVYGQYHWTMETNVCVVRPTEEGLEVHAATQWMDLVHQGICRALNMQQNKVDVHCRRIGGGYGMKLGRANQVAVATALIAHLLNRPCRMVVPLSTNMRAMGKRMPCSRDFEVGVNEKGVIQYVDCHLYGDNGWVFNEPLLALGMDVYHNCYNKALFNYTAYNCITDTASNTWCRSPGTLENIAMAELMMERIACELNLDPLQSRIANLAEEYRAEIIEMLEPFLERTQYDKRNAANENFNKNSRWTKRAMRPAFLRWEPVGSMNLEVTVSICADDGTVIITHGGIEMGQGINAKAIQIASYILKVPCEKIQVKANSTINAPNCSPSGGSITSQNVGIGVRKCCEDLIARFASIKSQMENPTWVQLVQKCYASQVSLKSCFYVTSADLISYHIFGIALCEVEVDTLTGEFQILKVDIIVDCGQSINPGIDCGQVEGAFMMGLGYWTSENLVYDKSTGECVSDRSWYYWPPQACDIPQNCTLMFKRRGYSTEIVYGAKGTGEPAACLSIVVVFALRAAMAAARKDAGYNINEWFQIDGPMTLDKICVGSGNNPKDFKLRDD